jgi:hypothetical protein
MTTPSLIFNPSRDEVWWKNFDSVKRFYEEHEHLTIRDKRLSGWLSYQRHHAKTLSREKLEALESIGYKSVKAHRACDERDWEENFNRLISDPSARKQRKMQMWLARQQRIAASGRLEPTRKHRLSEHGIDVDLLHRTNRGKQQPSKASEQKWMEKYNVLVKYRKNHGDCKVPNRFKDDPPLGNWVFNQRKRYHEVTADGLPNLEESRIKRLERIGFVWEINRRPSGCPLVNGRVDVVQIAKGTNDALKEFNQAT